MMISTGKNMIRKQSLQFQYNGKTDGFALQNEVSEWCNDILIPEMEKLFDNIFTDDIYLSIDKLEIEATADKTNWQENLRSELLKNLKEEIESHTRPVEKSENIVPSSSRKLDELILFYFKNGFLPWWSKTLMESDFSSLLLNWVKEDKGDLRKEAIANDLEKIMSRNVSERIVNILPRDYFFSFLKDLNKWNKKFIDSLEGFFQSDKSISKENEKKILDLALQFVSANDKNRISGEEQLFQIFYSEVKKETGITIRTFHGHEQKENEFLKEKTELEKLLKEDKPIVDRDSILKEATEGIYIENAGMVIITAFLPALFGKLKLINEGSILDPQTAVLIIQYANSGATNKEEFYFVLPKILCGLDIDFVIDTEMELADDQKKEVNEMLLSVIEHWPVLKNTSIDGLQESFLNRSGKLTANKNDWHLQVEKKSYDMLLNQLPWNISMVKLPWMKGVLRTEWM